MSQIVNCKDSATPLKCSSRSSRDLTANCSFEIMLFFHLIDLISVKYLVGFAAIKQIYYASKSLSNSWRLHCMYRMSSWYYNCLSIYSIYSVYTVFWDIPVRLSSPSIKRKVKCRPVNEFKSKKTFREFKDPVNTQLT